MPTCWSRPPGSSLARRVGRVRRRRKPRSGRRSSRTRRRAAGATPALCSLAEGLRRQGTLTRALAGCPRRRPDGGAASPGEYIGQALKALVMHEVGHTLGLRHNFRGSAGATKAQLVDRTFTQAHGLGVSVMDYSPPALSLDPRQQGDYHAGTIGTYDRWAIRYGYAEARASWPRPAGRAPARSAAGLDARRRDQCASAIASRGGQAGAPVRHRRGCRVRRARSRSHGVPLRPDQRSAGLGRDRVALINGLFDSLDTRMVAPGQGYARLADRVQRSAERSLVRDAGHDQVSRRRHDGPRSSGRSVARPALATVPAARQREALAFRHRGRLRGAGLSVPAGAAEPARPGPAGGTGGPRRGATAASISRCTTGPWPSSRSLLGQLLDPVVLSRIRDAELRAIDGRADRTIPELFGHPDPGHLGRGCAIRRRARQQCRANITSVRRDLQRLYLNSLIRMIVSPLPDTPEDARTLARATWRSWAASWTAHWCDAGAELDPYTRAHLVDSKERISQALNAQMIQTAGTAR